MAMEYVVQRLELGDVVLIDLDDQAGRVEATVVRAIDRTDTTVRVFAAGRRAGGIRQEWRLGERVTVVPGP